MSTGAKPGMVVHGKRVPASSRRDALPTPFPHDPGPRGRGRVCPWANPCQHSRPDTSGASVDEDEVAAARWYVASVHRQRDSQLPARPGVRPQGHVNGSTLFRCRRQADEACQFGLLASVEASSPSPRCRTIGPPSHIRPQRDPWLPACRMGRPQKDFVGRAQGAPLALLQVIDPLQYGRQGAGAQYVFSMRCRLTSSTLTCLRQTTRRTAADSGTRGSPRHSSRWRRSPLLALALFRAAVRVEGARATGLQTDAAPRGCLCAETVGTRAPRAPARDLVDTGERVPALGDTDVVDAGLPS